jgi:hypothetical protein
MNEKGRKLQPKLHLDIDFGTALARFTQTDPNELKEAQKMRDSDVIYMPRIASADFESFRHILKKEIATTFEEWTEGYRERVAHWSETSRIIEIDINPDDFIAFCRGKSRGYNARSLYDFAAEIGEAKR